MNKLGQILQQPFNCKCSHPFIQLGQKLQQDMATVQASKVCFIPLWNFHSNISHFGKYSAKYTQHAGNTPCRLSN